MQTDHKLDQFITDYRYDITG